jgi:hypothetical protein
MKDKKTRILVTTDVYISVSRGMRSFVGLPCICLDAMIHFEEVTSWSKKCLILDRGENMNKDAATK